MPETMAHVNCGNYDLVVIDEAHIFRNKKTPRVGSEIRYERLMRKLIKEGVKIRVLMLSSTPVNNRMADLVRQSMTPGAGWQSHLNRRQGLIVLAILDLMPGRRECAILLKSVARPD
jgi:hypothetical protein